jgi:CHAT domain-containing protein/Tfp pilus assembly protein PilF
MRKITVGLLSLLVAGSIVAQDTTPPELTPEEKKLAAEAMKLDEDSEEVFKQGKPAEALAMLRQSLQILQRVYPASRFPNGHGDLATVLDDVGLVLHATGAPAQGLPYHEQALAMRRKLYPIAQYPDGHADLAQSLNNMGRVLEAMGQPEQAFPYFRQGLAMRQKLFPFSKYPDGNTELAQSLNNVAFVLHVIGQAEAALPLYREALAMRQKLYPESKYPNGHPDLALSLGNMGFVLRTMGQADQALPYYRQGLEMYRKLYPASKYPDGHPDLALSSNNLGIVLQAIGQAEQALPYYRLGLEMNQKLYSESKYPNGHPRLAQSLFSLGSVFHALAQPEQTLLYYRQSLEMYQKLYPMSKYPNGHPFLAQTLNSVGFVLQELGKTEQALAYYHESLEMRRKLFPSMAYPDGHADLAQSLNNIGNALDALRRSEEAMSYYRQGLEMNRKLYPQFRYPNGHTALAISLVNLGYAWQAQGKPEQALPYYREALEIQQRLMRRELATASEEAAFDLLRAQLPVRDTYLGVTRTEPAPATFAKIWSSQSVVTRTLEQRHANIRAAGTAPGAKLDELKGVQRHIELLLQDARMNKDERDKLLLEYANKRDRLEREIVAAIPTLKHWEVLDGLGPDDLVNALPPGAVFLNLIRYTQFHDVDNKVYGTPNYVAFLVAKSPNTPGHDPIRVARVELNEAQPIDDAIASWRKAIESCHDSAAGASLREKIWDKLAPHIPSGTTTLYFAVEGDLARLPWAALPTGAGHILLEKYAVAQVPHGAFLLDQLKFAKVSPGEESLFALGNVEYGPGDWPPLPGTEIEVKSIAAIAPGKSDIIGGKEASAANVARRLPQALYAHLATHGEFQADALRAERQRAEEALKSHLPADGLPKLAAKNPLGFVGLVLAEGQILSGLSIVNLDLSNVQLVILSACETGLGEYTGGEGVQGLQRAFHLAGCPNVIASLWKVNDAATAALMAKFYHELWINKKPPIEALREAQLTVYYHPELVPDLAGERGAPKLKEAVAIRAGSVSDEGKKRADTKLWAAFVLSGVGK